MITHLHKTLNLLSLIGLLCCFHFELEAQGKNKIKYKFHEGKAILKSDLPIKGKFKYQPVKDDVPYWVFIDAERPNAEKKLIDVTLFKELTLLGAESIIEASKDSTHFKWVEEYDNLMRLVKDGEIALYDNSKIINEKYKYVDGYYLVGVRENYASRKLNKVKDLKPLMNDRPYFLESAELTGRVESRDLRVVAYLVDLFNAKKPMDMLQWENISFKHKGKTIRGKGYVQPVDLRNEYETSNKALIHVWSKNKFTIYESKTVKSLKVNGKIYEEGFYPLTNKTFLGEKWTHNNRQFLITQRILNNNSYYFVARFGEEQQSYIILENVAGSYMKPKDEMQLRKIFFDKKSK